MILSQGGKRSRKPSSRRLPSVFCLMPKRTIRGNTTGSTYDFAENFVTLMPLPSLTFPIISIQNCLANPGQIISNGYGIPQRIYAVCAFSAMRTGGRWPFTHIAIRSMNLVFSTPAVGRAHRKRLSTHHRFI